MGSHNIVQFLVAQIFLRANTNTTTDDDFIIIAHDGLTLARLFQVKFHSLASPMSSRFITYRSVTYRLPPTTIILAFTLLDTVTTASRIYRLAQAYYSRLTAGYYACRCTADTSHTALTAGPRLVYAPLHGFAEDCRAARAAPAPRACSRHFAAVRPRFRAAAISPLRNGVKYRRFGHASRSASEETGRPRTYIASLPLHDFIINASIGLRFYRKRLPPNHPLTMASGDEPPRWHCRDIIPLADTILHGRRRARE